MTPDSVSFVGDSYKEEEERASLVVSIEKATGEKVVEDEVRHMCTAVPYVLNS